MLQIFDMKTVSDIFGISVIAKLYQKDGSSYHSTQIAISYKDATVDILKVPSTYGYERQYEQTAMKEIAIKFSFNQEGNLGTWAKNNNIVLFSESFYTTKREAIAWGKN